MTTETTPFAATTAQDSNTTTDTTTSSSASNTTTTSTLPQEVVEFIGAGKKYTNEVEALKSIPHAQKHIKTLEEEITTIKGELAKRKSAEEILQEIRSTSTTTENNSTYTGITPAQIEAEVAKALNNKYTKDSETANTNSVVNTFLQKYGSKEAAEKAYIKLAEETSISVENLNFMARTSPKAVLKLAGMITSAPVIKAPSGSVNTEAFKGNADTNTNTAKVKGTSTKDLVSAWKSAAITT